MSKDDKRIDIKMSEQWYADGLYFECTACGNCCTGPEGYVLFDEDELKAMAEYQNISVAEFIQKYTHEVMGHASLAEVKTERGYDCIFLEDMGNGKRGCSIYPVRPTQCRTWPFWNENLRSEKHWQRGASTCPGMTAGGKKPVGNFVPLEDIRIQRDSTPSLFD